MTSTPSSRQLEWLEAQLASLRYGARKLEETCAEELAQIEPSHRNSAKNCLRYLSIRQHDIRSLQQDLSTLGLSSLGVLEPHAMASLDAVMGILRTAHRQNLHWRARGAGGFPHRAFAASGPHARAPGPGAAWKICAVCLSG